MKYFTYVITIAALSFNAEAQLSEGVDTTNNVGGDSTAAVDATGTSTTVGEGPIDSGVTTGGVCTAAVDAAGTPTTVGGDTTASGGDIVDAGVTKGGDSTATVDAAGETNTVDEGAVWQAVSPKEIARARSSIDYLKKTWGFVEPDRGNFDDPTIRWHKGKPDYTLSNLAYFLGKSKNHQEGSLELVVENLVKTWDMEATHKPYEQWSTVNLEKYRVSANRSKFMPGKEAAKIGKYNWLLATCPKHLYESSKETFESSHHIFLKAFSHGFPWEVLEVFSGPPKVSFSWRHWATFDGEFKGHKGNGEVVELTGFGVVTLEHMKICDLEIFYDGKKFIEVLMGLSDPQELKTIEAARTDPIMLTGGCPFGFSNSDIRTDRLYTTMMLSLRNCLKSQAGGNDSTQL